MRTAEAVSAVGSTVSFDLATAPELGVGRLSSRSPGRHRASMIGQEGMPPSRRRHDRGVARGYGPPVPVVVLRLVADDDLPLFYRWQRDPDSVRLAAVAARAQGPFLTHWAMIRADPATILRTIVADGAVAGHVVSWPAGTERMVGYWLGTPFWGRGIASAALALFLEVDGHRPLAATVAARNPASRRVLEKSGFRLRATAVVHDGPDGSLTEHRLRLDEPGRP